MIKRNKVRILCRNCNWIEYKKRKNLKWICIDANLVVNLF
jgi:hypothetical protein